jgi:hypothetical protein
LLVACGEPRPTPPVPGRPDAAPVAPDASAPPDAGRDTHDPSATTLVEAASDGCSLLAANGVAGEGWIVDCPARSTWTPTKIQVQDLRKALPDRLRAVFKRVLPKHDDERSRFVRTLPARLGQYTGRYTGVTTADGREVVHAELFCQEASDEAQRPAIAMPREHHRDDCVMHVDWDPRTGRFTDFGFGYAGSLLPTLSDN